MEFFAGWPVWVWVALYILAGFVTGVVMGVIRDGKPDADIAAVSSSFIWPAVLATLLLIAVVAM